ncbi:hypothetical protein FKM82_000951 [Ascaphus truei]
MASVAWKITSAVIGLVICIILAAVIAVIVIFVVLGSKTQSPTPRYYSGSFRILNFDYTENYKQSNSTEFKALSAQIQKLLDATFENSDLRSQYNLSQVISLSPGSVVPEFVLLFHIANTSKIGKSSTDPVQTIFFEDLTNKSGTPFDIDPASLQLTEISANAAMNLLYGALATSTTPTPTQTTEENFTGCGKRSLDPLSKIIGGTNAFLGAWPWQASLRQNGNHKCGATLISNTWLVTAAHCFDMNHDLNLWTVVLGTISLHSISGLRIQELIIYENYTSKTHTNDIAMLRLSTPVTFTRNIRPVCLPETSDIFPDDTSCFVTGWGALTSDAGALSPVLQQAQVKTINSSKCSSPQLYGDVITTSMICAGYVTGLIDACQGDSGGPLVTQAFNNTWFLIGTVSFGVGCAQPNKPGVYSNIIFLRNWIMEKTGV